MKHAASLLLTLAMLSAPAAADPGFVHNDRRNKAVSTWIEDLGSASYMRRKRAVHALQALGPISRQALHGALATRPELEVRLRIRRALNERTPSPKLAPRPESDFKGAIGGSSVPRVSNPERLGALLLLQGLQSANGAWLGQRRDDDLIATAAALMPFFEERQNHRYGQFRAAVKGGLRYIYKHLGADGRLRKRGRRPALSQAWCALAFARGYAVSKSPLLRRAAIRMTTVALDTTDPAAAAVALRAMRIGRAAGLKIAPAP